MNPGNLAHQLLIEGKLQLVILSTQGDAFSESSTTISFFLPSPFFPPTPLLITVALLLRQVEAALTAHQKEVDPGAVPTIATTIAPIPVSTITEIAAMMTGAPLADVRLYGGLVTGSVQHAEAITLLQDTVALDVK